ncbi:acyl-CoA thioesterase [Virgisporangium ochraceum]|uniref:acyl-CoA thioesterase n=1 Tax=Virgisporangium ochraceum TaxID=65505 RepID=UPI001EF1873B|nr:acyl-CoA thioesterase [Virgisporangium ochraceum]
MRSYELDPQGHVNGAVYVQYADHALYACVRAAGVDTDALLRSGVGPVNIETTMRFHRELRGGDEVTVSCAFEWGGGKTFRVRREFHNRAAVLVAEVCTVTGLLDLRTRRLVPDPAARWRAVAGHPEILGLAAVTNA